MPIRILAVVFLTLAAFAPSAAAAGTTLEGKTIGWADISLNFSDGGVPISWKVAPLSISCKKATLDTRKLTIRSFDTSSPDGFADVSRIKERYGRYTVRSTLDLNGEHVDGFWLGGFTRTSTVMRRGRTIDTCKEGAEWHTFED